MQNQAKRGRPHRRKRASSASRSVTMADVAKTAGVSTATVSRVLNGLSTVDHDLAQKVTTAIEKTGYVPNRMGRALRKQRSETWAAIVPDIQNSFFTSVITQVERIALDHGFVVVLCNTDERPDRQRHYIATAVAQQMSGVVVAPTALSEFSIEPLLNAHVPVVLIDRVPDGPETDSVTVDNTMAGALAAQHLLSQGFTHPACVAGPDDVDATEDRLNGFRKVLSEAGLPLSDSRLRRVDLQADGAEIATRSLLSDPERPDAIFAVNGPLTVGAFRGIQAHGLNLPTDIGLIGTDDDEWTQMVSPAVTVIQQPIDRIGRFAGELLAARSAGSNDPAHHIVLTPTLVPRGSTVRL